MDLQWILLALFLVAVISGMSKALSKSMLKNTLRLGAVVVAFLITFVMQMCGVFQNIVTTVTDAIGLMSMLGDLGGAGELIVALASTFVSPILFIIVFFPILWFFRIIIHFVVKGIEKKQEAMAEAAEEAKNAEPVAQAPETDEAPAEEPVADEAPTEEPVAEEATAEEAVAEDAAADDATEEQTPAEDTDATVALADSDSAVLTVEAPAEEPVAEETPAEEAPAEESEAEPVAAIEETPAADKKADKGKKKKKKKHAIYPECAWKRIISLASGAISSVLVFAVFLMPTFYFMSIVDTATDAIDGLDAEDSPVYQVIDVADEHIVSPFNDSFLNGFYHTTRVSDLLNYTTRAAGKIELDNGKTVYADDVLKNVVGHTVSLAAQVTSAESECPTVKEDVEALVSDPMIASILSELLVGVIADMELEEPTEDDLIGGLVYNFMSFYKNADKATIERDLLALGGAVGVLAEQGIIVQMLVGEVELESMLTDGDVLGDVVEAISGLSAFSSTIQNAFELGVEILGQTLQIPENDADVYDNFIDNLLNKMQKTSTIKFNDSTVRKDIQYYIVTVAKTGATVSSSNNIAGHNRFVAYAKHWEQVQSAFAHASEDKSYGYFTMQINVSGKLCTYIYDKTDKKIINYTDASDEVKAKYADKISPIAGLIGALATNSSTNRLTKDQLNKILTAYAASSSADEASRALATKMLSVDAYTTEAVTIEKMNAAINFTDWTDDEKAKDSRICVDIIMNLLGLMDSLGSLDATDGVDGAMDMIDQFTVLGQTMDDMQKTSCINKLPPLLMEGIIKNEMFANYMKPSIAFQINNIVENTDKTYTDSMKQIASVLKFAITVGGENQ